MKRIGEARLLRHLLDQCAGLLQAFGGMIHLEPEQVLIRRLLVITPEQTAQISVVDVALTGNLLQRSQSQVMLFNVASTLLIGRERKRFRTSEWRVRPDSAKCQTLQ